MADLPIGLQISKIHTFLQTELEAFSSEEILKETGIDIDANPDILLSLTGDASKILQEKDGKWRWASKYQVRNFAHLIALIARSKDGISEKDLFDSYKGVKKDIATLKAKKAVYEIKSGSKVLLFPKDDRLELNISDELKERYKSIILPDPLEVHRFLVSNGLKASDDKNGVHMAQPVTRKRPSSKQTAKRRNKKIKLTNTHMANTNIDLSKDFNSGRDSAFN